MARKIIIAEDDRKTAELIRTYLERDGYHCRIAPDGRAALDAIRSTRPDLAILDVMLPTMSGLDVCRALRHDGNPVAVIMVTARSTEDDKLLGLDLGADDYLTKPFSPRELVRRVRAVLRRSAPTTVESGPVVVGPISIDDERCEVWIGSSPVDLTPKEYGLLLALASAPGRAFSRLDLLDRAFGFDYDGLERTVDVHVMNLRRKLAVHGADRWIETVTGRGYRLRDSVGQVTA